MDATSPDVVWQLRAHFCRHDRLCEMVGAVLHDSHHVDDPDFRDVFADRITDALEVFFGDLGNSVDDAWPGAYQAMINLAIAPNKPTSNTWLGCMRRDGQSSIPAICLGAGPTAQDHLEEIAEVQGSFVVFASDVMGQACDRHGIRAPFITALERVESAIRENRTVDPTGRVCIAPPVIHWDITKHYDGRMIWWFTPDALSGWVMRNRDFLPVNSGPSCGTLGVIAALHAGCNPVYLIGHDLCYVDGESHAADTCDGVSTMHREWMDGLHQKEKTVSILDCFGKPAKTNLLWPRFKQCLEFMVRQYPTQKIFNVRRRSGNPIAGAEAISRLPTDFSEIQMEIDLPNENIGEKMPKRMSLAKHAFERAIRETGKIQWDIVDSMSLAKCTDIAGRLMITSMFPEHTAALAGYVLGPVYYGIHTRIYWQTPIDTKIYARSLRRLAIALRHACEKVVRTWPDVTAERPPKDRQARLRKMGRDYDAELAVCRIQSFGDLTEFDDLTLDQLRDLRKKIPQQPFAGHVDRAIRRKEVPDGCQEFAI